MAIVRTSLLVLMCYCILAPAVVFPDQSQQIIPEPNHKPPLALEKRPEVMQLSSECRAWQQRLLRWKSKWKRAVVIMLDCDRKLDSMNDEIRRIEEAGGNPSRSLESSRSQTSVRCRQNRADTAKWRRIYEECQSSARDAGCIFYGTLDENDIRRRMDERREQGND